MRLSRGGPASQYLLHRTSPLMGTKKPPRVPGRAGPLCPGDLKGIVHLDTEIPHGAFNLRMAEQKLHRAQVAGSAIDQRRLGSTQGMRGEFARVETDATDPLGYEPRILSRAQGAVRISASWEQVLASFASGPAKVVVKGFSGRLS